MTRTLLSILLAVSFITLAGCASTPSWGDINAGDIAAWKSHGFTPEEAVRFDGYGIGPDEAAQWRDGGFSPSQARDWSQDEFTPSEAIEWKEAGFGLSAARTNRKKGLSPIKEE